MALPAFRCCRCHEVGIDIHHIVALASDDLSASTATGESGKGILRDFNAPPGRGPRRDAYLSAAKHLPDRSRRVRLSSASEMTLCGQRLRYLPQRLSLSVQLAHQRDDFRNLLSV